MAGEIKPGAVVKVKVKRTPLKEAAAKTLSRLFAKDSTNKKQRRFRKKLLADAMDVRRRGGRPWEVRPQAPRLVQPGVGDSCTIRATMDVLGDLKSVSRFVEVTAAK